MHPGGVRTAMALFFFYKVSFEKHPIVHSKNISYYILTFMKKYFEHIQFPNRIDVKYIFQNSNFVLVREVFNVIHVHILRQVSQECSWFQLRLV